MPNFDRFIRVFRRSAIAVSMAVLLTTASGTAWAQTADVITHKVEKGQTLFAIARKYKASVADIRAANPGMTDQIEVGQEIKVPVKGSSAAAQEKKAPKEPARVAPEPVSDNEPSAAEPEVAGVKYHTVGAGQTLSMIARTYKVSVPDILKWNNLSNAGIRVGQKLKVSGSGGGNTAPVKETTQIATAPAKGAAPKAQPVVPQAVKEADAKNPVEAIIPASVSISKESGLAIQQEKGLAEGIDLDDNNKQQCLHRTAAIGTVVKVKNDLNGLSIYAKVVGKLENIGPNEKLLIRLSKSAFEKLMPTEKRFPVSISYTGNAPTADATK